MKKLGVIFGLYVYGLRPEPPCNVIVSPVM